MKTDRTIRFYAGTYTKGKKEGIYLCQLNSAGSITVEKAIDAGPNPSFLTADSSRRYLYAVNENTDSKEAGGVSAFAIDRESGDLKLLNRQPSHGSAPCHLTVDRANKFVLVANYASGSAAVFPIRADGSLDEASDVVQHSGSGPNQKRQEGPHAHCVALSRDNRFAYVVDLGIDKVTIYNFDSDKGKLRPAEQPWAKLSPGNGPRHLAFDRSGKRMYVISELSPTMTVFAVDFSNGALREVQTVSVIPSEYTGENYGAEVYAMPSGKIVYGSNRGHNSIVVFAVDETTGDLSPLQHQPTEGDWPRDFAVDPRGKFLLVANQRSDSITVLAIDPDDGTLTAVGHRALVPSPVSLLFM